MTTSVNTSSDQSLQNQIIALKREKNAIVLAHYYQEPAIQEVADVVGDSLYLAQKAAETDADIIVLSGVYFMAEVAKILNPNKTVLLPDLEAGCSLAESCNANDLAKFKQEHPDYMVVSYINCSADVKALSDIICTSSNAEKIINSISPDKPILFAPDKNLGKFLKSRTQREMALWDGVCHVHEAFSFDKLMALKKLHPDAEVLAHPESAPQVLEQADFIGSTAKMLNRVSESKKEKFIVGTEAGILHEMKKRAPNKILIPVPIAQQNACACSECNFMKMNTLAKLHSALLLGKPEVKMDEDVRIKAAIPLQKMLDLSN